MISWSINLASIDDYGQSLLPNIAEIRNSG
jgi:hypothetical protein